MEQQSTLQQHIEAQVKAGVRKDVLRETLTAVGWSEEEVDKAYAEALIASGVPVPGNGARGVLASRASTGDVVLNFFSFILLGVVAGGLGALYFGIIHMLFPDALDMAGYSSYYYRGVSSTIHYAIASLVVAFPLYYVTMRVWFKRFREDENKVESKLTKWLTYLVLLVSAVTIVGDLIVTINTFLQGEISVRFILKALTILVLAGMVFGFYFLERRKVQYRVEVSRKVFQLFGYVVTAIVLLGIITGFVLSGGPAEERKRTFDERRVQDMDSLEMCIQNYSDRMGVLPEELGDIRDIASSYGCANVALEDPETGVPYEYKVLGFQSATSTGKRVGTVELCATFSLKGEGKGVDTPLSIERGMRWFDHDGGRVCNEVTIVSQSATQGDVDLDIYPMKVGQ